MSVVKNRHIKRARRETMQPKGKPVSFCRINTGHHEFYLNDCNDTRFRNADEIGFCVMNADTPQEAAEKLREFIEDLIAAGVVWTID